jgi:ribosomal-protein-serine acetyltransferase
MNIIKPILLNFPDEFETERLLIRSPLPGDGHAVYEAVMESLVTLQPWLQFVHPIPSEEDIEESIRSARAKFITREDLRLHLYDRHSGSFLGSGGLHRINWTVGRFEIGYWLRDSASGKGYMTEAVNGITKFADHYFQPNRMEIRCDSRNLKSRQVAERCGFYLEATFRKNSVDTSGNLQDDLIFAKVRLPDGTLGYIP